MYVGCHSSLKCDFKSFSSTYKRNKMLVHSENGRVRWRFREMLAYKRGFIDNSNLFDCNSFNFNF